MLDSETLQDDVTRTRDGYYFLIDTFSSTLPEPPNETPERRHQRMQAAIAAVAGLSVPSVWRRPAWLLGMSRRTITPAIACAWSTNCTTISQCN